MSPKNKETGEIKEWVDAPEEQEEYWYINEFGTPTKADFVGRETLYDKCRKNFSNYFKTEEEAELTVRKLKAFKRLKDEGFEFNGIEFDGHGRIYINTNLSCEDLNVMENPNLESRLNLLFGGEK